MPNLEGPLAECITRFMYPGADEATIASYMGERHFKHTFKFASVLKDSAIQALVHDVCDADVAAEIKQSALQYEKHVQSFKAVAMPKAVAKAKAIKKEKVR